MPPGPPRRRRARPVADAPIDALLARSEDLTKGWLLALLEQAPLDEAPAILAAELASQGPRVCDAVVRALGNEDDLHRLEPGGALEMMASRAAEVAGAHGPESVARALDALQATIWAGILEELRHPDPDQVAELAQRLALAIELVRQAALRRQEEGWDSRAGRQPPRMGPLGIALARQGAQGPGEAAGPESEAGLEEPLGLPPEPPEPDIAPRAALWLGAVEDEIERAQSTGNPLALLLVELEDADRLLAVEPAREAAATFGRFAQAVRSAMRRQDILACESESRAWIIARDTGRLGAQALGARVAGEVGAEPSWRGAPLSVSIGVAVFGEDGRDSASLIEAAEESRYAAAASGISVLRVASAEDEQD